MNSDEKRFNPDKYRGASARIPDQYKFKTVYDEWLKLKKKHVEQGKRSPAYYEKLEQYKKKYASLYDADVRSIRTYHIQQFETSLPPTLSLKTQKNICDVLKCFLRYLHDTDYIAEMPKFTKYEVPENEPAWIDRATQLTILNNIEDRDCNRQFFEFMFETGLRPSEVRALKHSAIDWKNECIYIKAGFSGSVFREITKTRNQWAIPIISQVRSILERYPRNLKTPYVFWYQYKISCIRPYGEKKYRQLWNDACKKAGIEGVNVYEGCRHSFATQSVGEGIPIDLVGSMMGHKSAQTTKRYTHINKLKAMRERFER